MVQAGHFRWVEVTPSQFPHEAEGLALVRDLMPDETPFRAWSIRYIPRSITKRVFSFPFER